VLVVGSPYYNSNAGRIDIFRNTILITTVIGDAPNSYFGNKIAVSDDATTVLMGSEYYQNGRGIFNQFYKGERNFSVIGPATNMSYGQNILFDQVGNGVMYTNALITNDAHYTLYGVSPTANASIAVNVNKYNYNNGNNKFITNN
jgi:hypothetical protein